MLNQILNVWYDENDNMIKVFESRGQLGQNDADRVIAAFGGAYEDYFISCDENTWDIEIATDDYDREMIADMNNNEDDCKDLEDHIRRLLAENGIYITCNAEGYKWENCNDDFSLATLANLEWSDFECDDGDFLDPKNVLDEFFDHHGYHHFYDWSNPEFDELRKAAKDFEKNIGFVLFNWNWHEGELL